MKNKINSKNKIQITFELFNHNLETMGLAVHLKSQHKMNIERTHQGKY